MDGPGAFWLAGRALLGAFWLCPPRTRGSGLEWGPCPPSRLLFSEQGVNWGPDEAEEHLSQLATSKWEARAQPLCLTPALGERGGTATLGQGPGQRIFPAGCGAATRAAWAWTYVRLRPAQGGPCDSPEGTGSGSGGQGTRLPASSGQEGQHLPQQTTCGFQGRLSFPCFSNTEVGHVPRHWCVCTGRRAGSDEGRGLGYFTAVETEDGEVRDLPGSLGCVSWRPGQRPDPLPPE